MATPRNSPSTKKSGAKKSVSKSAKAGLSFPIGRVGSLLRKGQFASRVSASAAVYLTAVLEYLTAELLELSVASLKQGKKNNLRITPRALTLAVRNDDDLGTLLKDVTVSRGGVLPAANKALDKKKGKKVSATA